jgi:hypothetical protein
MAYKTLQKTTSNLEQLTKQSRHFFFNKSTPNARKYV